MQQKLRKIFGHSKKIDYLCTAFPTKSQSLTEGEMVEWSITTVLKTVVLRGTGGSNPSLSAQITKKETQAVSFFLLDSQYLTSISVR